MGLLLQPSIIQKENISGLNFVNRDVLSHYHDRRKRSDELYRALILGNVYRRKVKIIFQSIQGVKQVETTVWGVTEKSIILKNSVVIPIRSIYEVKPY